MRKKIRRDGKVVEYIFIPFKEEELNKLAKLLAFSAGAHMGIPPAGYKGKYEEWKEKHGWKIELKDRILHHRELGKEPSPGPTEAGDFHTTEELSAWLKKEFGK